MRQRIAKFITLTVLLLGVPRIALAQNLASLWLTPTSIYGGQISTGQVTLTGPAPPGGLAVQLSSSNPAVAAIPASVIMKGGEARVQFTVVTAQVKQAAAVMITAGAGGGSKPAVLVVNP